MCFNFLSKNSEFTPNYYCSDLWLCSFHVLICGAWWLFGRVDNFCPKGHWCDSRSRRHVGTLGMYFTHSCLWLIGMKFRHSIRAVSGAHLSSRGLEQGAIEIA